MWSFMHGMLNSDGLSVLLSQAGVVWCAVILSRGRLTITDGVISGACLSLAVLTKLTGFFLLVLFAFVVLHLVRTRSSSRRD